MGVGHPALRKEGVMADKYILKGRNVVPVDDLMEWAKTFSADGEGRRVKRTDSADGEVSISTVFLGLNYNFSSEGPPILFETRVFGGPDDGYTEKYSTYDEAEQGHERICAMFIKKRKEG